MPRHKKWKGYTMKNFIIPVERQAEFDNAMALGASKGWSFSDMLWYAVQALLKENAITHNNLFCEKVVTVNNIGLIVPRGDRIELCCCDASCILRARLGELHES